MTNSFSRSALMSALLVACSAANAVEYRLTTGFTTARSDNIGRVSEESGLVQKDWVHKPTVQAMLDHESNNLQLSADYLVEYRIYTEDVFDDRIRWTGRADLRWDAIPQFLQLNATNSRTETTEDALLQNVETNRQVTSVTSAGPKIFLRPRTSDELTLEYRYSDISQGQVNTGATVDPNIAQIDSDSTRELMGVGYRIGLSENRSILAEVTRDKVEFKQNAPELEIDTASLQYESKGDTLEFLARAGYTTIDRSLGRNKVDGVIGRLNLLWRVSGSGAIQLNASRSINDQSDNVLRGSADFGQGAVFQNTDVNEVFEEDVLRITYTHRWGRNTGRIGYSFQRQEFDDSAFAANQSRDEDQSGFSAFYERRLRPNLDVRLGANFLKREFDARGVDEDNLTANFRLDWRANRALTLFAGVDYEERDATGTSALVNQLSFDELVYLFGFSFDLVNRYKLPQKR